MQHSEVSDVLEIYSSALKCVSIVFLKCVSNLNLKFITWQYFTIFAILYYNYYKQNER